MRRFNPERELRKIQHGNRNKIIFSMIFGIILMAIGYSFALYQVRYSKRIIYTKVAPFSSKDIQLAVKIEGEEGSLDYFPKKEDSYEYVGTECEKENVTTVEWKETEWKLNLLTSGPNKCTVTFRQLKQAITTEVIGNGRVEPPEQEVVKGKNSGVFTVIPDEGNALDNVTCNNGQQVVREGNNFTVNNVTNDTKCTINILREYTITTKVEGGTATITPASQKVLANKDTEDFTLTNKEYVISNVACTNNQTVLKTLNTFKVTNVTSDSECTVTVSSTIPFNDIIVADNVNIFDDDPGQNLRYAGPSANVNNYIWFNCNSYEGITKDNATDTTHGCEKWRIIGLFKEVPKPGGTTEDLVKIIRADSVGRIAWDTTGGSYGKNNWTRPADLNTKLESYYNGTTLSDNYGSSAKGITAATQGMIEQVTWNIGGAYGGIAKLFYTNERGNTGGAASPAATTWNGYIGLMYPSDYGYATTGGDSTDRTACLTTVLADYNSDCYKKDWLYISGAYQWTLTPYRSNSSRVFRVIADGRAEADSDIFNIGTIRPSFYLKSSVKIKSGEETGGVEAPYILVP